MNEQQERVFKEARLNNLERTYAKIKEHAELTDTALQMQTEINILKSELGYDVGLNPSEK